MDRGARGGVGRVSKKRLRVDVLLGVAGRPSIGGATKVTPELGVGNPLNKEPHNGSGAERMWFALWC